MAAEALAREAGTEAEAGARAASQLQIIVHRRYNPEGITQYNIVPGPLVILQLTMVMMTAMALTRETERGTMENLLAMATPLEIMPGKDLALSDGGGCSWWWCWARPRRFLPFPSSAGCR
ncbi:MAG: hypothetical protein R3D78_10385 [Paracoccaceae bacterium]